MRANDRSRGGGGENEAQREKNVLHVGRDFRGEVGNERGRLN